MYSPRMIPPTTSLQGFENIITLSLASIVAVEKSAVNLTELSL